MFNESLTFGERLKLLRERKEVLQKELADFLQVKQQTVSAWEKNVGQPDIETIKKIAAFFNVSTDYLLGHSEKTADHPKTPDKKTIKSKPDLREGLSEEEQKQLETFRAFLISQREIKDGHDEQAAMGK